MMKVKLTERGKEYIKIHYPSGPMYEYDLEGEWELRSVTVREDTAIGEITYLGVPYILPMLIEQQPAFRVAE